MAGARRHFLKLLINTLYQVGFVVMLTLFADAVFMTGFSVARPTILEDTLTLALATPYEQRAALLDLFADAMVGPVPNVTLFIATLTILIALVWILRAWGAHRIVLQKTRWPSMAALMITLGVATLVVAFPVWVGIAAASAR